MLEVSATVSTLAELNGPEGSWLTLDFGPIWGSKDGRLHRRLVEPGERLRFLKAEAPLHDGTIWRYRFLAEDGVEVSFEDHTAQAFVDRGQFTLHWLIPDTPLGPRSRSSALAERGSATLAS